MTAQNQPTQAELREAATYVAVTRNAVVDTLLEFVDTYAVAFETASVQEGLEKFFGLADLEAFNGDLAEAKAAIANWTEASKTLLDLVGGRRS